jgi:hypothetical protein
MFKSSQFESWLDLVPATSLSRLVVWNCHVCDDDDENEFLEEPAGETDWESRFPHIEDRYCDMQVTVTIPFLFMPLND